MATPFKGTSYTRELVLQTAAQWGGTPDFYLQANQTGKESDTGLQKDGPGHWGDLPYSGGGIESVVAGSGISVDATDPANPVVALPYKVYRALLTQSGTNAPVATVLENSLGGTVVWTRNGVGDYRGALVGAFPVDKYFGPSPALTGWDESVNSGGGGSGMLISRLSDDVVIVSVLNGDSVLDHSPIEILVYP